MFKFLGKCFIGLCVLSLVVGNLPSQRSRTDAELNEDLRVFTTGVAEAALFILDIEEKIFDLLPVVTEMMCEIGKSYIEVLRLTTLHLHDAAIARIDRAAEDVAPTGDDVARTLRRTEKTPMDGLYYFKNDEMIEASGACYPPAKIFYDIPGGKPGKETRVLLPAQLEERGISPCVYYECCVKLDKRGRTDMFTVPEGTCAEHGGEPCFREEIEEVVEESTPMDGLYYFKGDEMVEGSGFCYPPAKIFYDTLGDTDDIRERVLLPEDLEARGIPRCESHCEHVATGHKFIARVGDRETYEGAVRCA